MFRRSRARVTSLTTAALLTTAAIAATAAPANAVTFDNEPVRITAHFTVAGHSYTLRDVSLGTATQTVHIGQHSGQYRSHYRLTLKDNTGHVLTKINRDLYKQDYILTTFSGQTFPTQRDFAKAEHHALHIAGTTAKNHWLKELRIQSVGADLESNIGVTLDYLDHLPAGTAPNFNDIKAIHSSEYRGSVTISGADTEHWSVIVRDTQDGYGEFYDNASSSETSFHF